MNFRFRSHEKLKDARSISYVFKYGNKFHQYPLLFLFAPLPTFDKIVHSSPSSDSHVQVHDAQAGSHSSQKLKYAPLKIAFTVPKRKFRKAADRNRIKRLMREAYRLQKNNISLDIKDDIQPVLGVIVIFIGNKIPEYSAIFKAMNRFIDQLATHT